jgi:DNA-binding NarL/FixJ family response regulator
VIIADSGSVLADLTAAVADVSGTHIARHASGRAPLDRLLLPLAPDLVVIGALTDPRLALARLAEVKRAAPAAKVVVLSERSEASWLADALRADAAAVLPGPVDPRTLAVVLREVIGAEGERASTPAAGGTKRELLLHGRRRRAGRTRIELTQEEAAA